MPNIWKVSSPHTPRLICQSSTTVPLFLGLFVKELQNASVCSICLYVHTYHINFQWPYLGETSYLGYSLKFLGAFQFCLKLYKHSRCFIWRPFYGYVCDLMPWLVFLSDTDFFLWEVHWGQRNIYNWDRLCSLWPMTWGWRNSWS
jgi:hypothetical protein